MYAIVFLLHPKLKNLRVTTMAPKEEEATHVEFNHDQDVGEANTGAVSEKEAFGERDGIGEKQALGNEGGWQASVEDAHLANINEHEITVRGAYVLCICRARFPSNLAV